MGTPWRTFLRGFATGLRPFISVWPVLIEGLRYLVVLMAVVAGVLMIWESLPMAFAEPAQTIGEVLIFWGGLMLVRAAVQALFLMFKAIWRNGK